MEHGERDAGRLYESGNKIDASTSFFWSAMILNDSGCWKLNQWVDWLTNIGICFEGLIDFVFVYSGYQISVSLYNLYVDLQVKASLLCK